jgi:predicted GIY-YIG superfamily endonuclease
MSATLDALVLKGHVVYRCFDEQDRLLYVGCTSNLLYRLSQHQGKAWFSLVARVVTVNYQTREEASQAEKEAIRAESPIHNIRCKEVEKPLTVDLLVRLAPITHQQLKIHAAVRRESMTKLVERAVGEMILRDLTAERAGKVGR